MWLCYVWFLWYLSFHLFVFGLIEISLSLVFVDGGKIERNIFAFIHLCIIIIFYWGGRGRRCIFCILNAVFILFFIHFEATYYTSLMTLWEEDAGKEKWRKVAEGMERSQMRGPKRCLPSPVKCWVVRKSLGVRSLSIEDSHELLSLFYPRFWMLILDVNLEEITHQMFPNYFINYFLFRYFFFTFYTQVLPSGWQRPRC